MVEFDVGNEFCKHCEKNKKKIEPDFELELELAPERVAIPVVEFDNKQKNIYKPRSLLRTSSSSQTLSD